MPMITPRIGLRVKELIDSLYQIQGLPYSYQMAADKILSRSWMLGTPDVHAITDIEGRPAIILWYDYPYDGKRIVIYDELVEFIRFVDGRVKAQVSFNVDECLTDFEIPYFFIADKVEIRYNGK